MPGSEAQDIGAPSNYLPFSSQITLPATVPSGTVSFLYPDSAPERVYNKAMKDHVYTAVIERDTATGYYVAYVPDLPGAHTQAETLEELQENLKEVVELVLEDAELPKPESKFVGTQLVIAE